jgi:hypothetical protein
MIARQTGMVVWMPRMMVLAEGAVHAVQGGFWRVAP